MEHLQGKTVAYILALVSLTQLEQCRQITEELKNSFMGSSYKSTDLHDIFISVRRDSSCY
jgi:hypothetical protein